MLHGLLLICCIAYLLTCLQLEHPAPTEQGRIRGHASCMATLGVLKETIKRERDPLPVFSLRTTARSILDVGYNMRWQCQPRIITSCICGRRREAKITDCPSLSHASRLPPRSFITPSMNIQCLRDTRDEQHRLTGCLLNSIASRLLA